MLQRIWLFYQEKDVNKEYCCIIVSFLIVMIAQLPLHARQSPVPAQHHSKSLVLEGTMSLDSLTRYVHLQTGIRFSFNSRKVKGSTHIQFPKGLYTQKRLLEYIKKTTRLSYTLFKGYVIFTDRPIEKKTAPGEAAAVPAKKKEPPKPVSTSPRKKEPPHSVLPQPADPPAPKGSLPVAAVIIDTAVKPNTSSVSLPALRRTIKLRRSNPAISINNPAAGREGKSFSPGAFHFRSGLHVSELLFPAVSMEAGVERIHLTFSAGTNFRLLMWGAGIGSILAGSEKSEWQVNASVNFLKKNDGFTGIRDTLKKNFTMKGQLFSAGISWNRFIGEQWLVKIGPTFNLLRTKFYVKGEPATPLSISKEPGAGEAGFKLLNPPILLRNTYREDAVANNKTWIGLKVGIYYSFPLRR